VRLDGTWLSTSNSSDHCFQRLSEPAIRKVQAMRDLSSTFESGAPFPAGLKVDFLSRDPDEMSERSPYWGLDELQLGSGRFEGIIRAIHSGRVQLNCARRNMGSLIQGSIPSEAVVLASVRQQTGPVLFRGVPIAGHQLLWVDSQKEIDCRTLGGSEMITVAVHAPLFHEIAQATLGPAFFDGKARDRFALRGPQMRPRLNRRLLDLLEQGFNQSASLSNQESSRAWEQRVLDALLADVTAPELGVSPAVRHRAARQAEAFLREHRDRRVTVAELCLATGVPKRTLMLGFHNLFGIPPLAYHRRTRLGEARRDLVHSWPGETSVTTVALRWGFDHFGRFSINYREMFGESPITTLRGLSPT
jgi:AraC family transcriptional regulator, ethanolamine operon transcriptional activator